MEPYRLLLCIHVALVASAVVADSFVGGFEPEIAAFAFEDDRETDVERDRRAIWTSPEMRAAIAWAAERFREGGQTGQSRMRDYFYELSRLDARGMRDWIADVDRKRQAELSRQFENQAVAQFELLRAATFDLHQSRYRSHLAQQEAMRSRSVAETARRAGEARRRASAGRVKRPGPVSATTTGACGR